MDALQLAMFHFPDIISLDQSIIKSKRRTREVPDGAEGLEAFIYCQGLSTTGGGRKRLLYPREKTDIRFQHSKRSSIGCTGKNGILFF